MRHELVCGVYYILCAGHGDCENGVSERSRQTPRVMEVFLKRKEDGTDRVNPLGEAYRNKLGRWASRGCCVLPSTSGWVLKNSSSCQELGPLKLQAIKSPHRVWKSVGNWGSH